MRIASIVLSAVLALSMFTPVMAQDLPTSRHAQTTSDTAIMAANSQAIERVLVEFHKQPTTSDFKTLGTQGGEVTKQYKNLDVVALEIPKVALDGLKNNPNVKRVEIDGKVQIAAQTLDWGMAVTKAQESQASGLTGAGIKIAVLDTGIQLDHEDLIVKGGVSFVANNPSFSDDHGHGTHVAGIIGAENNGIGTVGVAPDADIYAIKVLNQSGSGYDSDVISGIDWAITNKMDIINLSLGGDEGNSFLKDAVDKAFANGILVVAAAGNDGDVDPSGNTVDYPAKYASTIAVSAIDSRLQRSSFSSAGEEVDVSAPGSYILSTTNNGAYGYKSGTSMATPYVAGTLALIKQNNPTWTAQQLRDYLEFTATDLGVVGYDVAFGNGLVQAPLRNANVAPPLPSTPLPIRMLGNGGIEVFVKGDDKANIATDDITGNLLTVTIKDRNGVDVSKDATITEGKYMSTTDLAPGNYTVTISNGKVWQSTTVAVKASKLPKTTPANFVWESAISGIQDTQGRITKTGAMSGVVYTDAKETTLATNTTVQIVSANAKTTWQTTTNTNGFFKVFVPSGKYHVVVVGKEKNVTEDLVQNMLYEGISVTAGLSASPIEALRDEVLWNGTKEVHFNFTPTQVPASSTKLIGTASANATVAVYTVGDNGVRRFIAEAKTNAKGAYTIQLPHALAGEKIVYEVTDKANNVFEKIVDVPKSHTLPVLTASSRIGSVKNATKVTAVAMKNTMNKLYVVKGNTVRSNVAGDLLPVDSVRLPTTDIDMTNYSHLTVYEVSPTGKIIKAKTLTGKALKKAL